MHLPRQVAQKIFYTTIAVIGVPVNLMAILVLFWGKCGLSSCSTRYLVAMAASDLMVIIIEIILRRFRFFYYPRCFLDLTPVCSALIAFRSAAIDCSVWFTVMFTFDRFVAIGSRKLKTKICTNKTATLVLATTTILLCLKNIPHYFRFEPSRIINNVSWYCKNKRIFYTDSRWRGFIDFALALNPLIPLAVILTLNALIFRRIFMASRARKSLKDQSKGDKHRDPEMESRKQSVGLVFAISCSFIILWLLYVLYIMDVPEIFFSGNDYYIFEAVAYMLRDLNCCTNTIIYVATQSNFRAELKRMLKYPFGWIAQYID